LDEVDNVTVSTDICASVRIIKEIYSFRHPHLEASTSVRRRVLEDVRKGFLSPIRDVLMEGE